MENPHNSFQKKRRQETCGKHGQTTVAPIKAWRGSPAVPPQFLTTGKENTGQDDLQLRSCENLSLIPPSFVIHAKSSFGLGTRLDPQQFL
jgi:hypothetical protein